MLHDKIRTSNEFNNIDSDQITDGNAMCYVGYDNDLSGRISLKINDGSAIRPLTRNAKVVDINLTSITNLNYQNGDIFYVDSVAAGDYIITVSNLGGLLLKGKNILLYLNNVPANTTISFGGETIINEPGSWCATFCNLLGTEVITCMSVWKTPGSDSNVAPVFNYKPLTFTGKAATNSVALGSVGTPDAITLSYKKNDGAWTAYSIGDVIDLNQNDTVAFSGNNDHFSKDSNYYKFQMIGSIEADGNIQSLMNFSDTTTNSCFNNLFNSCTQLTKAPKLLASSITQLCYYAMFYGCTSLSSAPSLPALTVGIASYNGMFTNCTALTDAPNLPATSLNTACYAGMFTNCTALTAAPALPALILAGTCYTSMFQGCTSLTDAPNLPATDLAGNCYIDMFKGCISLTGVPSALPALTAVTACYNGMFYGCSGLTDAPIICATVFYSGALNDMFNGCTSLTSITVNFTDWHYGSYSTLWVQGVAPTGIFTKPAELSTEFDPNHIPNGWTVVS